MEIVINFLALAAVGLFLYWVVSAPMVKYNRHRPKDKPGQR